MTRPIDPTPVGPQPSEDPGGFLVELLARYFKPGYVESLIRTWVPVGVGTIITWVLAWVAAHWRWHIPLNEHASTTVGMVATAVVIAVYYALGRWVERRWPAVGRFLVSLNLARSQPVYAAHDEAVRAVNAVTTSAPVSTYESGIVTGPPGGHM